MGLTDMPSMKCQGFRRNRGPHPRPRAHGAPRQAAHRSMTQAACGTGSAGAPIWARARRARAHRSRRHACAPPPPRAPVRRPLGRRPLARRRPPRRARRAGARPGRPCRSASGPRCGAPSRAARSRAWAQWRRSRLRGAPGLGAGGVPPTEGALHGTHFGSGADSACLAGCQGRCYARPAAAFNCIDSCSLAGRPRHAPQAGRRGGGRRGAQQAADARGAAAHL